MYLHINTLLVNPHGDIVQVDREYYTTPPLIHAVSVEHGTAVLIPISRFETKWQIYKGTQQLILF